MRCSMAKGNASNTSWDVCDRILADAGEAEKPQPMTGEQLLFSEDGAMLQVSPIRLGLGALEQILGLRPGEICEVYGGPGAGKTQLGLTVAACAAGAAHPVLFVTAKDHPSALAERLHTILLGRKMNEAALDRLRIYQAMDFADFAKIILSFGDTLKSQQNSKPLVVVDGLTSLLSPFTSASSWAHRWRLTWAWRALRQLAMPRGATMCGSCVLILSHTVNEGTLALGQQWNPAATRRLELSPGHLELQMAKRGIPVANGATQAATAVDLVISDAGVCAET